jgi:hypothetical protein
VTEHIKCSSIKNWEFFSEIIVLENLPDQLHLTRVAGCELRLLGLVPTLLISSNQIHGRVGESYVDTVSSNKKERRGKKCKRYKGRVK